MKISIILGDSAFHPSGELAAFISAPNEKGVLQFNCNSKEHVMEETKKAKEIGLRAMYYHFNNVGHPYQMDIILPAKARLVITDF